MTDKPERLREPKELIAAWHALAREVERLSGDSCPKAYVLGLVAAGNAMADRLAATAKEQP